jgi:hypothetical protein
MTGLGWEHTGPIWSTRVYAPAKGQDHLGLGSVSSDQILPMLSPGINVLTIHPRYWSFYCWVLDSFWNADRPRTRASFRDFYRPREALFAMACHVCDAAEHPPAMGNVVGSLRIRAKAGDEWFNPQFDYIKEPLGGYGLYYRSTMEATDTIAVANAASRFPFDAATPEGRALAAAFGSAVGDTALGARMASGDALTETVTRADLVAFAREACLCQLRLADGFDLPLLRDLFLHGGREQEARARRYTLRMLLDLSQAVPDTAIDQTTFRQLVYFRTLGTLTYQPRSDLRDTARRWRTYQAREYFAFIFNRLLGWVTRRGLHESDDGLFPLPAERLRQMLDHALDGNTFAQDRELGRRPVRAGTTAADFAATLAAEVDVTPGVDEPWPRHDLLDEHALYDWCHSQEDDPETVVAMLAILLLLHRRVGSPDRLAALAADGLIGRGGSTRNGMSRFFTLLGPKITGGATLSELAWWLVNDYVIVQHERVATSKLPDDTFRVRRSGGEQLRFFQQEAPAQFADSRYLALSTTVHEVGLVSNLWQPGHRLSQAGRQLLRDGDLPAGALATAAAGLQPATVTG